MHSPSKRVMPWVVPQVMQALVMITWSRFLVLSEGPLGWHERNSLVPLRLAESMDPHPNLIYVTPSPTVLW